MTSTLPKASEELGLKDNVLHSVLDELASHLYRRQINNTDFVRFPEAAIGPLSRLKDFVKSKVIDLAGKKGFLHLDRLSLMNIAKGLQEILDRNEGLNRFYNLLQNESSRRLMIMLLTFRILGKQRVKLPLNDPHYWGSISLIKKKLLKRPRTIPIELLSGYLHYYELEEMGFPIHVHAHDLNILDTFLLQQYRYDREGTVIQAEPGDVVIDAGGCWGDTALYFASRIGQEGRVFCFEFTPSNLRILQQNLDLNRSLAARVEVIPQPVWDKSGEHLSYYENGPATSLMLGEKQSSRVLSKSIDDFVAEQALQRVDFIKMDIEGAELKALQGAEQTLKAFRPKLAIALYHRADDFVDIPSYLESLNLNYEFFLDHFTIHLEETVLFASPPN